MALTFDTRTATEYGVVRTFAHANFQFTTQGNNTVNPNSISTSLPVAGTTSLFNEPAEGYVGVEYLFIQFAGFTFGKSASAYATPWNGFPGNISSSLIGGPDTTTGVNNIQYTVDFASGVSGSVSLDDPTVYGRTNVYNLSLSLTRLWKLATPMPVFVLRMSSVTSGVDQAWGLFQLSAAAHEVNGS